MKVLLELDGNCSRGAELMPEQGRMIVVEERLDASNYAETIHRF